MRKTLIIAIGAAVALVMAAVALAAVFTATGISPATATLVADKASDVDSRTCKGGDGKEFTITNGRYAGTAAFTTPVTAPAGALNGDLTIRARTTFDTSSKLGYVVGSFSIKDSDTRVQGSFAGTLNGNALSGFLSGVSRGSNAKVLGTLSGTFNPATGLTGGALGTGSIAHAVVAGPICKNPRPAPKPKRLEIKGSLALDGTKVSVTRSDRFTATCTDAGKPPLATGFANGDKVEMKCENPGSGWIVTSLKKVEQPAPAPKRLSIEGKLSIGTGSPVTVSVTHSGRFTATCTVDTSSPSLNGFANDDKVEMKCENPGSGWLLRGLKKNR